MEIEKQLSEKNYADIDFRADNHDIAKALDSFDEFIKADTSFLKNAGDYAIKGFSNGRFGYFARTANSDENGRAKSADTKHEYHFGSKTRQRLESSIYRNIPSEFRIFCDNAENIYWKAVESLRNTLLSMYQEHDSWRPTPHNLTPEFLDKNDDLNLHLRFVGYEEPDDKNIPIAGEHFDRSVFTLALAETHPGLQIGTNPDGSDLKDVIHEEGKAKFFAGKGWEKMPYYLRNGYEYVNPAYHRVKNIGEYTLNSSGIARHAIVMFANPLEHQTDPTPEETRPNRK
jgi:hypothetical protein